MLCIGTGDVGHRRALWTTWGAQEPDNSWNSEPGSVSGHPHVCGTSGGLWGPYESVSPPSLAGHLCQAAALCVTIPCFELCEYLFSLPTLISFPFLKKIQRQTLKSPDPTLCGPNGIAEIMASIMCNNWGYFKSHVKEQGGVAISSGTSCWILK